MPSTNPTRTHLDNFPGRCFACIRHCWMASESLTNGCMGESRPTGPFFSWYWETHGSPGCVRCLN